MSKKATIILLAVLLLLVSAFYAVHQAFLPEAETGDKRIVFQVSFADGSQKNFDILTDAETLADALLEEKLIDAEEGPYGLWVTAVFGEKADSAANEYWMFYKDGVELATGVSDTYIANGEHYEARIVRY